jgi:ABC-type multidrug transport system fused ATPase/permease subunit
MTEAAGTGPSRRVSGVVRRMAPFVEGRWAEVAIFGTASLLAGFAEAGLLFTIVRAATAMSADEDVVTVELGPVGPIDASVADLFLLSGAGLVVVFGLAVLTSFIAARLTAHAVLQSRESMIESFLGTSWSVQSRERAGGLQELLSSHANRVALGIVTLTNALAALVSFVAFMTSAVLISPTTALVIVVGVGALYVLLLPLTRLTRARSRRQAQLNADFAVEVTQVVTMAREVKLFGVERPVASELSDRARDAARAQRTTRVLARLTPQVYQYLALLLVIGGLALVRALDLGDIAELGAVIILLIRALSYSQQLSSASQQAAELEPYLDALEARTNAYAGELSIDGPEPLDEVEVLELDDVAFTYDGSRPVLDGVDLRIERGEVIGIVGPSGSGKSTLVQLILRLRAPQSGRYLVNGHAADRYAAADWSRRFVLVPQDNALWRGTVLDNIRFHRAWVSDEEAIDAARRAHLDAEIARMPAGYATVVGSGAADLSGGQRQRLGLARALAGGPSVLVLDEPTSALDMHSEALVQETLAELRGDVTLFIVAHRLSTLSVCDRILVLDHGRVQAFGTRDEVIERSAFFAEAVRLAELPA